MLNDAKYIGLDVHQATISVVVLDGTGHLVMESVIETKAATILQLLYGLSGTLHVTFEEGTCAAWLHDLLKPHVAKVVVCDPRKNALLKAGNKNDRIDARKLADLLRSGLLSAVYHGEKGVRTPKTAGRRFMLQLFLRVISTRRFFWRPSGSSAPLGFLFGATGLVSPKPWVVMGFETPCVTSQVFTESARRSDSVWLYCFSPLPSVWPPMVQGYAA